MNSSVLSIVRGGFWKRYSDPNFHNVIINAIAVMFLYSGHFGSCAIAVSSRSVFNTVNKLLFILRRVRDSSAEDSSAVRKPPTVDESTAEESTADESTVDESAPHSTLCTINYELMLSA